MSERKSKISNGKTKYLNSLSGHLEFCEDAKKTILDKNLFNDMSEAQNGVIRLPRSTLLIGDKLYNNVWHPADELEKSFKTMEKQPFIMNHGEDIEDEIGFMENAEYDAETKKLTAIPVLNLNTEKGMTALNHMRNRLMANKVPETSVGFWATEHLEQISLLENAEHLSARDWEFDHNSLVTRGAGSPGMGIGIGLSKNNQEKNMEITLNKKEETQMEEEKKVNDEPEKFTQTKEEFHKMKMDELAKQEAEYKKRFENDTKTMEEEYKKKVTQLESQVAARTTMTRDTMQIQNQCGPVTPEKARHIRKRVGGLAFLKYVRDNAAPSSLVYENENALPDDMR